MRPGAGNDRLARGAPIKGATTGGRATVFQAVRKEWGSGGMGGTYGKTSRDGAEPLGDEEDDEVLGEGEDDGAVGHCLRAVPPYHSVPICRSVLPDHSVLSVHRVPAHGGPSVLQGAHPFSRAGWERGTLGWGGDDLLTDDAETAFAANWFGFGSYLIDLGV